ncbi:hypothetical protein EV715DRAFT_297736 [Schizophyllum commune]
MAQESPAILKSPIPPSRAFHHHHPAPANLASCPSSAQDPLPTSTHPGPCPEGESAPLETAAETIARLEERVAKADKEIEELRGKRARKPSAFATAASHKLVSLFEPLIELQREADRRSDYGDKTTNPQDQRGADRKYKSYSLLISLLPETRSKIAKGDAALREFFTEARADVARGDDISKVKAAVAEWLNASPYNCTPPLSSRSREKRGFQNRVTGKQMPPIEYDCDNPVVFENIKRGDPNDVEHLFLRGPLLLKTVCLIFTAPSSSDTVDDDDGEEEASESSPSKKHKDNAGKATKSPVATLLHMNGEITPRAIAYAAILMLFYQGIQLSVQLVIVESSLHLVSFMFVWQE